MNSISYVIRYYTHKIPICQEENLLTGIEKEYKRLKCENGNYENQKKGYKKT